MNFSPPSAPSPRRACTAAAVLGLGLFAAAAQAQPAETTRLVERGRYLVEAIMACGNCHTPQGPQGPVAAKALAGGLPFVEKAFNAVAANITPDPETGIGRWTDAQIVTAIREGKRPDGSLIGPPMPFALYRQIGDRDAQAVVAYLRSVPAVKNAVPKSDYRMPLPPAWGPPVGKVAATPSGSLEYGAYLAGPLGHCLECHSTPDERGVPNLATGLGGGGMQFNGPWGVSTAPAITAPALARYNDDALKKIITTGLRPDGSRLKPPMGTAYYARMTASDQDSLVRYLRTLQPK
jgi:mono/diheme cytochrome c family protein